MRRGGPVGKFGIPSTWHKSSRSGTSGCIAVARLADRVFVRDSKNPEGPALRFTQQRWHSFLQHLTSITRNNEP
ncbi:MAG: DUF397 domain-containing protein [Dactylosporangium sp.]|nr:DUF397 domain-containing protein [Dactylosporangium sp.]NNJ61665.1 DUF397 domain-containing protein [Dactylosporangium sp.]